MDNTDEFYSKLKVQLDDTTMFPADYLYKFIVPTLENQAAEVKRIFDNTGAVIKTKKSKTGKYVSVSIIIKLKTSDEVIVNYKKASKIKGIISL
jgi:putative lipoic acid-binding regulatory protein